MTPISKCLVVEIVAGDYQDNMSTGSGSEVSESARLPDDESDDGGQDTAEGGATPVDDEVAYY